ncbi:MAG: YIP1 family protein [Mycoplasmatota bacterium]
MKKETKKETTPVETAPVEATPVEATPVEVAPVMVQTVEVKKRFCPNCGRQLGENEICSCQTVKTSDFDFQKTAIEIKDLIVSVFKKPVTTINSIMGAQSNTTTYMLLGLVVLVAALVSTLMVKELTESISSLFGFGYYSYNSVEFDFLDTFIKTILSSAGYLAILVTSIWLVAEKLFKKQFTFKNSLTLVANTSSINVVVNLLTLIAMYLSAQIMTCVMLIGGLFYNCVLFQSIKSTTNTEDDKASYMFVTIMSVVAVVVYIVLKVIN